MAIEKKFLEKFIRATEFGAYGAFPFIGKGDKSAADRGAVDKMRNILNKIDMKATIVIGEGEMDKAPMLNIGEKVGNNNGPEFDIAVDPLEGTTFTSKGLPNAFSVLAVTEKGNLLSAPDTYMEKIIVGANVPKNLLDLDNSVEKNINLLADVKKKIPSELNACVMKRPRHKHIIKKLMEMGVNINFITDGDIAGGLSVIGDTPKNDIYIGTGGGPEGVIVAAALSCLGGQMQGRLILNKDEIIRATKLGIIDFEKKYDLDEIVKGDVIFCASGVTSGDLAKGIKNFEDNFEVTTLALHKSQKINKTITNTYNK
tara:strand:- start:476 stop:1417 length:942 start_codon:yes stop_codon:yes gene_type:complete